VPARPEPVAASVAAPSISHPPPGPAGKAQAKAGNARDQGPGHDRNPRVRIRAHQACTLPPEIPGQAARPGRQEEQAPRGLPGMTVTLSPDLGEQPMLVISRIAAREDTTGTCQLALAAGCYDPSWLQERSSGKAPECQQPNSMPTWTGWTSRSARRSASCVATSSRRSPMRSSTSPTPCPAARSPARRSPASPPSRITSATCPQRLGVSRPGRRTGRLREVIWSPALPRRLAAIGPLGQEAHRRPAAAGTPGGRRPAAVLSIHAVVRISGRSLIGTTERRNQPGDHALGRAEHLHLCAAVSQLGSPDLRQIGGSARVLSGIPSSLDVTAPYCPTSAARRFHNSGQLGVCG
jgi:hypothetical protein